MTDETHSPMGGSAIARILACPPSYGLIERTGAKDKESPHAALGTAAHKLADMCLESGKDAWEYIGQTIMGYEVGSDPLTQIEPDAVQVYLDYVRSIMGGADDYASEVAIGKMWKPHPLYGGTADFVAVKPGSIDVVDYKHGAGLGVEAIGNAQLQYYAIGAFKEMGQHLADEASVEMVIVQPRYHGEPIKTWAVTVGELRQWARSVLVPGMNLATEIASWDAPPEPDDYNPGDHCRFCPAIIHCPKQKEDFKIMSETNPEITSDAELDAMFPKIATVKMFMNSVEAAIQARLIEGAPYTNVKLTNKRAAGREWKEDAEEKLKEWLGEDAYDKKLKSPAQVEKLSPAKGKAFVAEMAFLPEGTGYKLVPASDSAPAANPAADMAKQFSHY